MDARLIADGGADVVHRLALELVGFHHVARLRESFARERVRRYDDHLNPVRLLVVGRLLGERGHGESGCKGR